MSAAFRDPSWQQRISITLNTGPEGKSELPFVIGVLADFSGMPEKSPPRLRDRRFINTEISNFDDVLGAYEPHLTLNVANRLSDDPNAGEIKVDLSFRELDDFAPERIAHQIEPLYVLLDLRARLSDLRNSLLAKDGLDEMLQDALADNEKRNLLRAALDPDRSSPPEPSPAPPPMPLSPEPRKMLPPLPEQGVWSRGVGAEESSFFDELVDAFQDITPQQQETTRINLTEFVSQVLDGSTTLGSDIETTIVARIQQIDRLLSVQLAEVLHHPAFLKLESTWRGLRFLILRTRKAQSVQVRILNITKNELLRQFLNERERYDSAVARKVLAQAADTPGAIPFGLLISDFTIGSDSGDLVILEKMAKIGAAAHVPFVASADSTLFGFSDFTQIAEARLLERAFDADKFTRLHSLRARPQSRYIGLVLPRVLLREPYSDRQKSIEQFVFEENVDAADRSTFLWGSAVWAFAAHQATDFDRYGWFGAERSLDDPGALTNLPRFVFRTEDGGLAWLGPVEVALSDTRYLELRSLGLIPICQIADTDRATFFETWSLRKPNVDSDNEGLATHEGAEIDCVLCVSRIAHYLRSILQTERQKFSSVQECEEYLRNWIAPYVVPEYAKGTRFESAFPLLGAQFHIALATEPSRPALLQALLLPKRMAGTPHHPIEITIPIALPWSLALSSEPPRDTLQVSTVATTLMTRMLHANDSGSGRDRFIHRTFAAEACIANRKLDAAILILEDLVEQIDRYRLYEWESPQIITQVWDLLRHCYLLTAGATGADEQSTELLRKICRLDPSRVIE